MRHASLGGAGSGRLLRLIGVSALRIGLLAPIACAGLLACSPALDWREVRPEGGVLLAWLPCKPERLTRQMPLGNPGEGAARPVEMLACTALGTTWGITSMPVPDDAAVAAALQALRAARPRNLDGRETEVAPAALPGIAPRPEALRFTVAGKRPDGSEVVERAVVFAHGGRVFHAAALGGSPTAEALETFFENLKPPP